MKFNGLLQMEFEADTDEHARQRMKRLVNMIEEHSPRLGIRPTISTFAVQPGQRPAPETLFDDEEES